MSTVDQFLAGDVAAAVQHLPQKVLILNFQTAPAAE